MEKNFSVEAFLPPGIKRLRSMKYEFFELTFYENLSPTVSCKKTLRYSLLHQHNDTLILNAQPDALKGSKNFRLTKLHGN